MTIQFRHRSPSDAEVFQRTLDTVCRERRYLAFLEAPPVEGCRQFIKELEEKKCPQWVALEGETIVGWADIIIGSAAMGQEHLGRLGMGLLASHRGQGLGRALLERVVEDARQLGLVRVELSVFGSNERAITLYQACGFEIEGRRRKARLVDGQFDDVVMMGLLLR